MAHFIPLKGALLHGEIGIFWSKLSPLSLILETLNQRKMIRNVFTGGTIQRTNKQLLAAACSTKNIEVWRHVTMGAKFLDLNNLSWQRQPFALSNYRSKVWAAILFLWETGHGKVLQCQMFRFFCYIWRIWNFTTFATRRNYYPSLFP